MALSLLTLALHLQAHPSLMPPLLAFTRCSTLRPTDCQVCRPASLLLPTWPPTPHPLAPSLTLRPHPLLAPAPAAHGLLGMQGCWSLAPTCPLNDALPAHPSPPAPNTHPSPSPQNSPSPPPAACPCAPQTAGYAGLLVAAPTVLYEIIAYVVPGLTKSERTFLAPIVFGSSILFYFGWVARVGGWQRGWMCA